MPIPTDPNPYWPTIVSSTITVAVGGFVTLFVWLFQKRVERRISTFDHRHSIFCEKQEEAISATYALIWECHVGAQTIWRLDDLELFEAEVVSYRAVQNKAALYFLGKCFYFPGDLFTSVQKLFTLYNDSVVLHGQYLKGKKNSELSFIPQEQFQAAKMQIDPLLVRTRDAFYNTLFTA